MKNFNDQIADPQKMNHKLLFNEYKQKLINYLLESLVLEYELIICSFVNNSNGKLCRNFQK